MAKAADVLSVALGEVGYYAPADPEQGSKYGRWMAELYGERWLAGPSSEIWWCNIFVSWCLAQAGQECTGYPSYNTDVTLGRGPQLVYREDARPGDIVIWNWDGGGTDHVGFVLEHEPGSLGRIVTVEGNYRNAVSVVDRSGVWSLVSAVIRPPYDAEAEAPKPSAGIVVDGWWGRDTTSALQRAFGTPADGEVWHQWQESVKGSTALTYGWAYDLSGDGSPLVAAMQRWLDVEVDGLVGPETLKALQAEMGQRPTGVLDGPSETVMEMQRRLNSGELL